MPLYAISDLHLSFAKGKTMDRFGNLWVGHTKRLFENWHRIVADEDTVLICGDISWAMRWEDFIPDMHYLASLSGSKIISRGNHDFYWQSKAKMTASLPQGITALEQSSCIAEGYSIVGVKGWLTPGATLYDADTDEKYFMRERERLKRAISEATGAGLPIIVMMHFPPFASSRDIGFTDILEEFGVISCIYGHLHNGMWQEQRGGVYNGISYQLVSADYLAFCPTRITVQQGY